MPYRDQSRVLHGRYAYVLSQPFEFALALAAFWGGGGLFVLPRILSQVAVGRVLGSPWDQIWAATYAAAGLLMLIGLAARRPRVEMPGVLLIAGGSLTQGITLAAVFGIQGLLSVPQFWFIAIGATLRVVVLVEAGRLAARRR